MQAAPPPDWAGRTVVCLASGPSLIADDVAAVQLAGHPVVVTNTTFRIAPWADVLFGFDARWWREHIAEVRLTFKGRLMSGSLMAPKAGPVETLHAAPWFRRYGNSGACAVSIAVGAGAKRIVLLGYDCCRGRDSQRAWHWHGDHPNGISNCKSMAKWPYQFGKLADWAKGQGVQVINASRRTALVCFERSDLPSALS